MNSKLLTLYAALTIACSMSVARAAQNDSEKEHELIGVLKSSASPGEKALACKRLAIYGSAEAVPALAPLLADPELASWARIPLEAIPGPAADDALRAALGQLQGRLLVGVINSIGVRRDANAVESLSDRLKDPDPEVASTAAVALGRIGGARAARALRSYVRRAPEAVQGSAAEGCIRCAEGLMAEGKFSAAVQLYDTVRRAKVPKQKVLEATRGAILARQSKGTRLLLAQLQSDDRDFFAIGLRTARELPGVEVSVAVTKQLWASTSDRQPLILLALADREDSVAKETVLNCARSGGKPVRLTAIQILDRKGDISSFPVLLQDATGDDADLAHAATGALVRLQGNEVDSAVLSGLGDATGKGRQVLLEVACKRGLNGCLPAAVASAADTDPGIRGASLQAISTLGGIPQVPALVKLLENAPGPSFRDELEKALLGVCGRTGASCAQPLRPLAEDSDGDLRIVAVHALAAAGGPEALTTITAAVHDKDETVQDEAVRTLSSWPNTWPDDGAVAGPLLAIAKDRTRTSHQVLAVRGYLRYIEVDKQLNDAQKLERLSEIVPLIQRAEEKRAAIAVAQHNQSAGALKLLSGFAQDPAVAGDACSAIVEIAGKDSAGIKPDERKQALQLVTEKSANAALKQQAEAALKKLQ